MPRPKKTATVEAVQEEKKSDGLIALEHLPRRADCLSVASLMILSMAL